MLAHPTEPLLFFGIGDTFTVFGRDQIHQTVKMPPASSHVSLAQPFSDFVWYDGQLWFAYDNKVYRRTPAGEVRAVADIPVLYVTGRFCIQGGEVLTPDGNAVRISDGRKRSWISAGNLTAGEFSTVLDIQAAMQAVYCSPTGQGVYAPTPTKIRMIFPL